MNILEIFRSFTTAIAGIQLHRASMRYATIREHLFILEVQRNSEGTDTETPISLHNHFFEDAISGRAVFYGFHEVTVDNAIKNLVHHTNRQHQWLLVEAYESFEVFVNRAYAFMGLDFPTHWPLRDFGDIQLTEVRKQNFQWYLERSREKKGAPLSMLRQFKKTLPRMANLELSNRINCDFLVAVMLIGQMRHCIVHTRGIIPDKATFAAELLRKLGHSGAGMTKHLKFIDETLLVGEEGAIQLLTATVPDSTSPIQFHDYLFDDMVRYLLMYAHQVYLSLGGTVETRFETASAILPLPEGERV